jgi:hypothetical protein
MGALYSASGRKRLRGRRPDKEIEKDSHLSRSRKTGKVVLGRFHIYEYVNH